MFNDLRSKTSRPITGIILLIIALAFGAFSGALMKALSVSLSPFFIAWLRFTGSLIILAPVTVIRFKSRAFRPKRPLLQVFRGILLVIGTASFVYGVREIDYANAIAILYVYPFLMMMLAPILLGEKGNIYAWIGVLGGFFGVLCVMRPDIGKLDYNAFFILLAGLMVAVQMLINRLLGGDIDPFVISMWGSMVASFALLPLLPFVWVTLTPHQLGIAGLMACMTALSQTMMVAAMSRAPVSLMAPFAYTEIIFAVIIGFLIFGSLPDITAALGMILIIGSGIFVERIRSQQLSHKETL
jgi:drug/metabolite transporter (DMT)-like permease